MDTLFNQGVAEVGAALLEAKREYFTLYGANYLLYTQTLFGDPAMRLPRPEPAPPRPPQPTPSCR